MPEIWVSVSQYILTEKKVLMDLDLDDVIDRVAENSSLLRTLEQLAQIIESFCMHWGCALICPCFGAVV